MAVIGRGQRETEIFSDRTGPDEDIKQKIDTITNTIIQLEREKQRFVNTFLSIKPGFTLHDDFKTRHGILDDGLHIPVSLPSLSGMKIGAVDGSILRESLLGVDLIASKARGVVFRFYQRRPPVVRYFPQERNENFNLVGVFQTSNVQEIEFFASTERLLCELELVYKILCQEPGLDMMIIDGSLFMPELFKETGNPALQDHVKRATELLVDIVNTSEANHTLLVGVTKDSIKADHVHVMQALIAFSMKDDARFKAFLDLDVKKLVGVFKDYDFFFRFLEEGERSFAIRSWPREEPVPATKHVPVFQKYVSVKGLALHAYLIKCAPMDVPFKVELFAPAGDARARVERSASLLHPMSKIMLNYAEPSPQMEAHKRVRIPEQDFAIIVDTIRRQSGFCASLMDQRRNRKPF